MPATALTQMFKGLHPLVTAALMGAGMESQTAFQRQLLGVLGPNVPDVIAETTPGCGHVSMMLAWAAHCVLSAEGANDKLAFIIPRAGEDSGAKIVEVAKKLAVHGLKVGTVDGEDDTTPSVARNVRVLLATPAALRRCRDLLSRCVTLVFEDVSSLPTNVAVDLIELVAKVNHTVTLCLFSTLRPAEVDMSIRYLLRRSNRRYLPADRRPSACFSTLLCHTQEEREEIALRITHLADLRKVLVMTHNREVKELRQNIADRAKLNTHMIHRATPTNDRQRVLADFIQSQFAVLVTMDAFTGVDLMDVDAVINYYPPQKSMPDTEWDTYVACVQSTGDPARPCLVATVAAPDDITMICYFMQKLRVSGPILNVAPTHPDFEDIVRYPEAALLLQGPDQPPKLVQQMKEMQARESSARGAAAAGSGTHAGPHHGGQHPQHPLPPPRRQQHHVDVVSDSSMTPTSDRSKPFNVHSKQQHHQQQQHHHNGAAHGPGTHKEWKDHAAHAGNGNGGHQQHLGGKGSPHYHHNDRASPNAPSAVDDAAHAKPHYSKPARAHAQTHENTPVQQPQRPLPKHAQQQPQQQPQQQHSVSHGGTTHNKKTAPQQQQQQQQPQQQQQQQQQPTAAKAGSGGTNHQGKQWYGKKGSNQNTG
jgi:hypothetical protein